MRASRNQVARAVLSAVVVGGTNNGSTDDLGSCKYHAGPVSEPGAGSCVWEEVDMWDPTVRGCRAGGGRLRLPGRRDLKLGVHRAGRVWSGPAGSPASTVYVSYNGGID